MKESEQRELFIRTALVIVFAFTMGWMLSRSYDSSPFITEILQNVGDSIAPANAVGIEFISIGLLGVYLGLLGLFTLDERKRVQGILLGIGSFVGLIVLSLSDILLPNINYIDPFNILSLVGGIIIGLSFGGKQLFNVINSGMGKSQVDLSFPIAAWSLYSFISVMLLGGLLAALGSGTAVAFIDIPLTAGTIYVLFGFIKYTSESNVAVIGPRESGKSLLLLGLYLSYRERGLAGSPEGYMKDLITQADSITQGDDFPIVNTYNLEKLWFFLSKGGLFPKRIKINTTDHTGELMTRLADDLATSWGVREKIELLKTKYRIYNPLVTYTPGGEASYHLFQHQVRTSDVMLLCVDVDRLEHGDVDFVESLETIGTRAKANGADIIIVATKCDLLIDEFSEIVDEPLPALETEFRNTVNDILFDRFAGVTELCDAVDVEEIYPVYYKTELVDGNRIPDVGESGALQSRGMDTLGTELRDRLE